MKLRAPRGCGSISYKGRMLVVAADGSLDVEDEGAGEVMAHGFAPFDECSVMQPVDPSREELVKRILDLTRRNLDASDTETIRARIKMLESGIVRDPGGPGPSEETLDAGKVQDDVIENLNRSALFAILRKKRVRVTIPITNEQLRVAVRQALAK